jgi:hypothetical protein
VVYGGVCRYLISPIRNHRLSSLRLLASSFIQKSPAIEKVLALCCSGEEVPLDMEGVRERSVIIQKVPLHLEEGPTIVEDATYVAARWLVGKLLDSSLEVA